MPPGPVYARGAHGAVAYEAVGESGPDLLVLKPLFFPVDLMRDDPSFVRLIEGVASFSRSIWFDPRGCGASDPIEHVEGRLMESWVDDAITVLDDLGLEQVDMLAFIGPPAMLLAAAHPQKLKSLTLVNPAARFRQADGYPEGIPDEDLDRFLERIRDQWGTGAFAAALTASRASDERFHRWCARCERLAMTPSEGFWRFRASLELDMRDVLPAIRVPTLVVSRAQRAPSRFVAEHIEDARLVEVAGTDLFPLGDGDTRMLGAVEEFITGGLPTHSADRMLATVMFTDVVQSTETLVDTGDRRWRELLATHDHLVRAQLARFEGHEVKATGDGFLATFDGPGRSIKCAAEIRDQLRTIGVEVRIGLHVGEIERHADDVTGIAVHVAQRIQAAAAPGEILLSRTVVDLVAGSGLEFADRGTHTLKGVPGTWPLFAATS